LTVRLTAPPAGLVVGAAWIARPALLVSEAVALFGAWTASPEYVAVSVRAPAAEAVYVTAQLDEFPPPAFSVHVACGEKLPPVAGTTLQVIVPVGMTFWPLPLSVTVAVQVTAVPTTTTLGVHVATVVATRTTASEYGALVLAVCRASPAYAAPIV